MNRIAAILCVLGIVPIAAAEPVGERPYEMVWANRTEDSRPPLVDFDNLDGWRTETTDAAATFALSREQQIWGRGVGKLVYRSTGKSPVVTVRPGEPIAIAGPFDCMNFWVYGNNWGWAPDKTTPPVEISVLLRNRGGREVRVSLGAVRWKEWWLMHHKLTAEQLALLSGGAAFEGIRVTGGRNAEDRTLYFDNLSFYQETLKPLTFDPRPKRGIEPFEGQTQGTNTGPGLLPFPTREETILPDNRTADFRTSLRQNGDAFVFQYDGADGKLEYVYQPRTGTLSDVTAQWIGRGERFQPMADGGVLFFSDEPNKSLAPEKIERLSCERQGDAVVSRWKCRLGDRSAEVQYRLTLRQKSLLVDVKCLGGEIGEVRFGKAVGTDQPRLVTIPYISYAGPRPAVLVAGPTDRPLFLFGLPDYYRSNASALWAANTIAPEGVVFNGGTRYEPKTDGRRNDCFERFFLTVSPRFEEILPNIPNPPSPWMHVAGERVWCAYGASDRAKNYEFWKNVARHGMTKIALTDHETGWRDGGESFTFRTRAAPKKGGDESQADYARKLHALGFRYGIYNNYTDFAPVNEFWDEDMVTRLPTGEWRTAWPRCYNPKPARAVEYEARLAPIIQQKFKLSTAYCDVHTAVAPWQYCDFDARVPGAGTFAATLFAYGEIMLHQKATWNGPVYSEGNHHWFYCGLTDGNYGQDSAAHLASNPWLVDFDLRKLHRLCCNFGMGNPGMFYGREDRLGNTPEERDERLDRFLAATLAFGHTGFFVTEGGISNSVRSYFALQPIHAAYAQQAAAEIRYADEKGRLLETSEAVATGAFRRSQIATRYADGLRVIVNGHPTEIWKTPDAELPPNGWFAKSADGKLFAESANIAGRRADYVVAPDFLYVDGRGRFVRFAEAAADGPMIALRRPAGAFELIPVGKCSSFGVRTDGKTATVIALDAEGKELGPAETRFSRGLVFVVPKAKAFSYVVKPGAEPANVLKCERDAVVPGEVVMVEGRQRHAFRVPANAKLGTRIWQTYEDAWIDFTVVPLVEAKLQLDNQLRLELLPHHPVPGQAKITLGDDGKTVELAPEKPVRLDFEFRRPNKEEVRELPLRIEMGELRFEQKWRLATNRSIVSLAAMPDRFETGQCLRKGTPGGLDGKSGAGVHADHHMSCSEQTKPGVFMHPPYKGGVGNSYAVYEPVDLPRQPAAAFRCEIGKRDGSDRGDGILFRIAVVEPNGQETIVAEKQWAEHGWTPLESDLGRWAGKSIRLKLISDVGPADNSSGDWACWAAMRIETREPVLRTRLKGSGE